MTGRGRMSFLRKWEETGLTASLPSTPTSSGAPRCWPSRDLRRRGECPEEWVLPQTLYPEENGPSSCLERGHA
jgi:hypothetical protein